MFAGSSKVFTQANKDQQRELNHEVNSFYNPDILGETIVKKKLVLAVVIRYKFIQEYSCNILRCLH